ncbi:hypothetical protein MRX96_048512 [Rhipicephalus microplus]
MGQGSKSSAGSAKKSKSLSQRAPQVTLVSLAQDDGSSKIPQPSALETNQEAKRRIVQLAVMVTVCCALMVAVMVVYVVLIWTKKTVEYCVSTSSSEHAEWLRRTVNASGDPCNDFWHSSAVAGNVTTPPFLSSTK